MWEHEVLEPRLTAGWSIDAGDAPPLLREMCGLLSSRYDVGFDSVWVNLYRDGQDSVAWHGDRHLPKTAKQVGARMSVTIRHSRPATGERIKPAPTPRVARSR
jgi:hypothetical protein